MTEITLMLDNAEIEATQVEQAIGSIEGVELEKTGEERSLGQGVQKAVQWIMKLVGSSAEIADKLIEQATKELAGANLKIKFGPTEIEVTNANRSQIKDILELAFSFEKGKKT